MSSVTYAMFTDSLSVLGNPETNAQSRALALSIIHAYVPPPHGIPVEVPAPVPAVAQEPEKPAAVAAVAAAAGDTCGHSTAKWRSYCEHAVHDEVVIVTRRTVKAGRFQPTQAELALNVRMDKSQAIPALLYEGVRYLSPNSLTFAKRAVDSQKVYVERDGVWKSLFQLANGE